MLDLTKSIISNIHPEWKSLLQSSSYDLRTKIDVLNDCLVQVLDNKTKTKKKLCPSEPTMLLRFLEMDPNDIRVIIFGENPYPQPGVANGFAFSCESKQPSVMIFEKELQLEYQSDSFLDYSLKSWVDQGVLLINSSLSCDEYGGTHFDFWKSFLLELISCLNNLKVTQVEMNSLVFVLLGKSREFRSLINEGWHSVIERPHPIENTDGSNIFTGFFKEVNNKLKEQNHKIINWI